MPDLRIDANYRLVAAAQIGGVDGKIGHAPDFVILPRMGIKALLDRVLMRPRKGGEHQFACIRVARVDGELVAIFDRRDDLVDVAEIEAGVQPLRVHVERQRDEIDIAGSLAITEQTAFDSVGAREKAKLCRRDAAAAIIVRVKRNDDAVARADVAAHPFDLVGIYIGHRCLDRGGQIEDQRLFGGRLQNGHHRLAYLEAEFELGGGEGFGAVLEMPVGLREARGLFREDCRAFDRDGLYACLVELEHNVAPCWRYRVVEMDNGARCTGHAFEGLLDQIAARLRETLDHHIVGDAPAIDQIADEVEIGRATRRKADFDLLHPNFDQQIEKAVLFLGTHRVDQRLIAVTQVGRKPTRRLRYGSRRPDAVGQIDHAGMVGIYGRDRITSLDLLILARRQWPVGCGRFGCSPRRAVRRSRTRTHA